MAVLIPIGLRYSRCCNFILKKRQLLIGTRHQYTKHKLGQNSASVDRNNKLHLHDAGFCYVLSQTVATRARRVASLPAAQCQKFTDAGPPGVRRDQRRRCGGQTGRRPARQTGRKRHACIRHDACLSDTRPGSLNAGRKRGRTDRAEKMVLVYDFSAGSVVSYFLANSNTIYSASDFGIDAT